MSTSSTVSTIGTSFWNMTLSSHVTRTSTSFSRTGVNFYVINKIIGGHFTFLKCVYCVNDFLGNVVNASFTINQIKFILAFIKFLNRRRFVIVNFDSVGNDLWVSIICSP